MNNLLRTDSYKAGHAYLYPTWLGNTYAYVEAREGGLYDHVVFFGLQYYLKKFFSEPFFTLENIEEAYQFWNQHFGQYTYFPYWAWRAMYYRYAGYLPVTIKAIAEGSRVPTGSVLLTIESTDEDFPWLPGFLETLLLKVWYPSTIATQSYEIKKSLKPLFDIYADDPNALDFAVHDFGYRGCTSEEQAMLGGAAHLLSFSGTDTVAGIVMLQDYYQGGMEGYSIPATEHSIMMSHENERAAFKHLLDKYPEGTIACVCDTYDLFDAIRKLGTEFKDQILARDGRLVVRPDSGDPNTIVLQVLNDLVRYFGCTSTSEGTLLLPPQIRVIQGDGMDRESIPALYQYIVDSGFAPDNLVVGSGGGLLQKVNRDTLRFAYKVSSVRERGSSVNWPVRKNPATDPTKTSKAGRFDDHAELIEVVSNGHMCKEYTVAEVQANLYG